MQACPGCLKLRSRTSEPATEDTRKLCLVDDRALPSVREVSQSPQRHDALVSDFDASPSVQHRLSRQNIATCQSER